MIPKFKKIHFNHSKLLQVSVTAMNTFIHFVDVMFSRNIC